MRRLVAFAVAILFLFGLGCSNWVGDNRQQVVSGTIETDESRVASRYGGRVEQILAQEGDILRPGQVIVRLNAPELHSRHAHAKALLEELIAGPRKEEILAAKHDWEALTAELEFARTDAKRMGELFQERTVSESERDRALSSASMLEKSVAAAKSRYDLVLAGTRGERIAQARAQVSELEAQLQEMEIVSPTNAVLEVLSVKLGDVLGPNQEVATLLFPNYTWVRVYVPEPWLGHISVRERVKIRVDSFPGKDFTGEVEQIARTAEFTPRNVQTVEERVKQVFGIKIRVRDEALRAGMAADVYFPRVPKKQQ